MIYRRIEKHTEQFLVPSMNVILGILIWSALGALVGLLAYMFMPTHTTQGPLADMLVGVIGATIGGIISIILLPVNNAVEGGFLSIACAFFAAIILSLIMKMLTPPL